MKKWYVTQDVQSKYKYPVVGQEIEDASHDAVFKVVFVSKLCTNVMLVSNCGRHAYALTYMKVAGAPKMKVRHMGRTTGFNEGTTTGVLTLEARATGCIQFRTDDKETVEVKAGMQLRELGTDALHDVIHVGTDNTLVTSDGHNTYVVTPSWQGRRYVGLKLTDAVEPEDEEERELDDTDHMP